jgi:hypothetical protein
LYATDDENYYEVKHVFVIVESTMSLRWSTI